MDSPPSGTVISARVPNATAQQLRQIADDHATTTSRLVGYILAGALQRTDDQGVTGER